MCIKVAVQKAITSIIWYGYVRGYTCPSGPRADLRSSWSRAHPKPHPQVQPHPQNLINPTLWAFSYGFSYAFLSKIKPWARLMVNHDSQPSVKLGSTVLSETPTFGTVTTLHNHLIGQCHRGNNRKNHPWICFKWMKLLKLVGARKKKWLVVLRRERLEVSAW